MGGTGTKQLRSRTYITKPERHGVGTTVSGLRLDHLDHHRVELGFELSGDQRPVRRQPIDPVRDDAARGRQRAVAEALEQRDKSAVGA